MKKPVLTLTTFAFILACRKALLSPRKASEMRDHEGHRMMGCSMMGRGGMMGHGAAMRVIFALMDSDGDGNRLHCRNFKLLTKRFSKRWIPTKTALLPSRRYRPS